jgi:antitoxin VapB
VRCFWFVPLARFEPGPLVRPNRTAMLVGYDVIGAVRGYARRSKIKGISRIITSVYNLEMALSIKDPEADRLARELAARTGETLTEAVVVALRERLARQAGRTGVTPLRDELAAIRRRCAALPASDDRSAEEIVGYDERGLPS